MTTHLTAPAHVHTGTMKWAFLLSGLVVSTLVFGQGKLVDRRDQAEGWYLPVHGQVMVNGEKADTYELVLYKDNVELGKAASGKKGRFELELDIDQHYSIRVVKPGYQEKMIHFDTALPKDLVQYPAYDCFVNLVPSDTKHMDPFYTDFPSAIVRYDPDMGGFYHSEHYLTHIQTRVAGIASATF